MENYKYTVTENHLNYLHTNDKQLAIKAVKGINGAAYYESNGEMICFYSYKDDLNLKPITLNGDMANEFNNSFPSEEDYWDGDETDKIAY